MKKESDTFRDRYNLPITASDYELRNGISQSKDILLKVISDRVTLTNKTIDELTALIEERRMLKDDLNSTIDDELCEIQSTIYALELDMCGVIDKSNRRISLEQQICALYKEKRQHKLSHWQDTAKLKHERRKVEKELRSAMLDLWMVRFLSSDLAAK